MRGATNSQRYIEDGDCAFLTVDSSHTYATNENIIFLNQTGRPLPSWLTLNNDGTFTMKKGGKYLINYHFTPSTVEALVTGNNSYTSVPVWRTTGNTEYYNALNDVTTFLRNSGQPNTFVWFTMCIQRLAQGGGVS